MIAIIDYKAGNLASVANALHAIGAGFTVTNQTTVLDTADGVIFPGVGHAAAAMEALQENNLVDWLKSCTKPLLGICLGMQLLFDSSEEGGQTAGLGLLPGKLKKFGPESGKVPHMGWNQIEIKKEHPLLSGIENGAWFYHVHSFYAPETPHTIATCSYGPAFSAIVANQNIMGAQFHPEKSGVAGEKLLKNFIKML